MLQSGIGRRAQTLSHVLNLRASATRTNFSFSRPSLKPTSPNFLTVAAHRDSSDLIPLRKKLKDEAKIKKASGIKDAVQSSTSKDLDPRLAGWELTVGIEIHAQLNTARKLFSSASRRVSSSITVLTSSCIVASTSINEPPNTHVTLFDLSVPGSLPLFQKATLLPALRAAIALNCAIQPVSRFDRKHYFYHDQPAGYQITQYYQPFAKGGSVILTTDDGIGSEDEPEVAIGIKQIQMEQDTAKSQEQDDETTLLDYNRSGHPLIEIISLPQIHSPETAAAYVRKVQAILFSVDAVTTGMEMGGLRADVNVSVRRRSAGPGVHQYGGIFGLGQRTEIKNLSTLKGVEDAIRAERDRQVDVLESGGTIIGETRGWSVASPSETRRLRGKEGEVDYRYMPDPDISPLFISEEVVDHLKKTLPSLPEQIVSILIDKAQYGLSSTDAKILLSIDGGERLDYFQDVVDALTQRQSGQGDVLVENSYGKLAGNWVLHEMGSLLATTETSWVENKVSAGTLAEILDHLVRNKITGSTAKQILKMVFEGDTRSIDLIIAEEGLAFRPIVDDQYERLAKAVMEENETVVQQIREKGRTGKLMFLVGQMMRTGEDGRVEARKAEAVLRQLISSKGASE